MIKKIKKYLKKLKKKLVKKSKFTTEYDFDEEVGDWKIFIFTMLIGYILASNSNNFIFFAGINIQLIAVLYIMGKSAVNWEQEDTWKDEKTMEIRKSRKLSDDWEKEHPILSFLQDCYYDYGRKVEIPEDIYRNIKWFIQRGNRGYSDSDVWGLYYHINRVMIGALKDLKKQVHGYPCGLGNDPKNEGDGKAGIKEWKQILSEIIWMFEANQKIENNDWLYVENERSRKRMENLTARLNSPEKKKHRLFKDSPPHKWHLMTKEECQRYRQGWKYFQKHYFSLWD